MIITYLQNKVTKIALSESWLGQPQIMMTICIICLHIFSIRLLCCRRGVDTYWALIVAIQTPVLWQCWINWPGCFRQWLKRSPDLETSAGWPKNKTHTVFVHILLNIILNIKIMCGEELIFLLTWILHISPNAKKTPNNQILKI